MLSDKDIMDALRDDNQHLKKLLRERYNLAQRIAEEILGWNQTLVSTIAQDPRVWMGKDRDGSYVIKSGAYELEKNVFEELKTLLEERDEQN